MALARATRPGLTHMTRILPLLLLASLLLACGRQQPAKEGAPTAAADSKTILGERVEGSSPFFVQMYFAGPPHAEKETKLQFSVGEAGKPVSGADVKVSLVMPLMDMGKNESAAREIRPGLYEAAATFGMADEWEVFVRVAKDGKKGTHVFNIKVTE